MAPLAPAKPNRQVVPSPERVHLTALDGVRGVAILMVMLMHSFEVNFAGGKAIQLIGDFVGLGRLGVDLFFVLSGFLITGILLDTRRDPQFFRRFYVRRTLRIFPLYYGIVLLLLALTPLLHLQWKGMFWWLALYLQNFVPTRIMNFHLAPIGLGLYHLWSLAVEEQFYLVWPFIVYLLKGRRRPVAIMAIVLALGVVALRLGIVYTGHGTEYIHTGMFTRADQLLLGGLVATLYRSETWWPRVASMGPWLLFGGVLVHLSAWASTGHFEHVSPFYMLGFAYTIYALSAVGAIIWALKLGSAFQRVMQLSPLRSLGKYSYGLYIMHVPIITLLQVPMREWLRNHLHSRALSIGITAPTLLILSFLLAWLSFRYYEMPFLSLKRYFDYTSILPARVSRDS